MQLRGEGAEGFGVLADQFEEGAAPRSEGHHIDQCEPAVASAMQQMGPQSDRPA
jgi:hypothetical protein